MGLRWTATPAEQAECGVERVPSTVPVLPAPGLQNQSRGFRLQAALPLTHERQMFDDVLVQHVFPPFSRIDDNDSWNCCVKSRG